jgi:hypothetical protein
VAGNETAASFSRKNHQPLAAMGRWRCRRLRAEIDQRLEPPWSAFDAVV